MPRSLCLRDSHPPPSPWPSRLHGRVGRRLVGRVGPVLLALMLASLCVGAPVGRTAPSSANAATVAEAAALRDETARFAGIWVRDRDNVHIVVTVSGDVWSDLGAMQGRVLRNEPGGGDFSFGRGGVACRYTIVPAGVGGGMTWRLLDDTSREHCPEGRFRRLF